MFRGRQLLRSNVRKSTWIEPYRIEHARNFGLRFSLPGVAFLILSALLSSLACSQDSATLTDDETSPAVPVYRFETRLIRHWLMLGPLLNDDELAAPDEGLADPYAGKTVQLVSGEQAVWHPVTLPTNSPPDSNEYYGLQDPTRQLGYLFCKIKNGQNMSHGQKQFYFGCDDAGKVWIDGDLVVESTEPRWHAPLSDPFEIEMSDREIDCLLELRNMGGDHSFSLGAGYSMRGQCLCLDNVTPQKNISISLVQDDLILETEWSDSTGFFEIEMVPYTSDIHLLLSSGRHRTRWPAQGSLLETSKASRILLPVANLPNLKRYSTREGFPAGAISAIAESPDGRLMASAGNVVVLFDGSRAVTRYRLPESNVISKIVVEKNGTAWIGTRQSGLYRAAAGGPPRRFAKSILAPCIYDFELDSTGSLWISSGNETVTRNYDGKGQGSHEGKIHRVDPKLRVTVEAIQNKCFVVDIACDSAGRVAFAGPRGPVSIRDSLGNIRSIPLWKTMKKNLVSEIVFDLSGKLWVNRVLDVGCLNSDETWNVISIPTTRESHLPLNRICIDTAGTIWLTKTNRVFQIDNDQPVFIGKTGGTYDICGTQNGSVYIATPEGICKIVNQPVQRIDHRHGLTIESPYRIESNGAFVLVSGDDGSATIDASGAVTQIDDSFVVNSPWGSRYRFNGGLSMYRLFGTNSTVKPVEILHDSTERVVESRQTIVRNSACYFSKYLDHGLLGQNGKIFELRGHELTPSGLLYGYFLRPNGAPNQNAINDIFYAPPNRSHRWLLDHTGQPTPIPVEVKFGRPTVFTRQRNKCSPSIPAPFKRRPARRHRQWNPKSRFRRRRMRFG